MLQICTADEAGTGKDLPARYNRSTLADGLALKELLVRLLVIIITFQKAKPNQY